MCPPHCVRASQLDFFQNFEPERVLQFIFKKGWWQSLCSHGRVQNRRSLIAGGEIFWPNCQLIGNCDLRVVRTDLLVSIRENYVGLPWIILKSLFVTFIYLFVIVIAWVMFKLPDCCLCSIEIWCWLLYINTFNHRGRGDPMNQSDWRYRAVCSTRGLGFDPHGHMVVGRKKWLSRVSIKHQKVNRALV